MASDPLRQKKMIPRFEKFGKSHARNLQNSIAQEVQSESGISLNLLICARKSCHYRLLTIFDRKLVQEKAFKFVHFTDACVLGDLGDKK